MQAVDDSKRKSDLKDKNQMAFLASDSQSKSINRKGGTDLDNFDDQSKEKLLSGASSQESDLV